MTGPGVPGHDLARRGRGATIVREGRTTAAANATGITAACNIVVGDRGSAGL
ncbi:MAG: hypothetical protein AAFR65_05175 [Pseudomonadota bacterium]